MVRTRDAKPIVEMVAALTGADFFEIVPVEVYSSDDISYNDNDSRANKEQNDNSVRSEIADQVLNMDQYDVAILAHPKMEQVFYCALCA